MLWHTNEQIPLRFKININIRSSPPDTIIDPTVESQSGVNINSSPHLTHLSLPPSPSSFLLWYLTIMNVLHKSVL